MSLYQFPRWTDAIRPLLGVTALGAPVYLVLLFYYGASPMTLAVGYEPTQPIPFSHAVHAGELGIDCRYCHNTVDKAAHAAIPPIATCLNCHGDGEIGKGRIHLESEKLDPLREAAAGGEPLAWVRVHDLADYAYFNHAAHVNKGVSCVECHGRVDQMDVVRQVEPLSMGWCLDCHRDPAPHLRPLDQITNLGWVPEDGRSREEVGLELMEKYNVHPKQDCSTCHR